MKLSFNDTTLGSEFAFSLFQKYKSERQTYGASSTSFGAKPDDLERLRGLSLCPFSPDLRLSNIFRGLSHLARTSAAAVDLHVLTIFLTVETGSWSLTMLDSICSQVSEELFDEGSHVATLQRRVGVELRVVDYL